MIFTFILLVIKYSPMLIVSCYNDYNIFYICIDRINGKLNYDVLLENYGI